MTWRCSPLSSYILPRALWRAAPGAERVCVCACVRVCVGVACLRQVAANLREFHAEEDARAARKHQKSAAQKRDRDLQMLEQKSRAAASERLRKLEDDELSAHLRKEQELARVRAEEKKRANEEYHRQTKDANIRAKAEREEVCDDAPWVPLRPTLVGPQRPPPMPPTVVAVLACVPSFYRWRMWCVVCGAGAQGRVGRGDEAERAVEGGARQAGGGSHGAV